MNVLIVHMFNVGMKTRRQLTMSFSWYMAGVVNGHAFAIPMGRPYAPADW
jgi:hypothetical protein